MRLLSKLIPSTLAACVMSASGWAAPADETADTTSEVLRLAAGLANASSRMTAIGLSTLAEAEASALAIDTTWIKSGDDALERLRDDDVELALLPIDTIAPDALDRHPNLRAIMKYWPTDDDDQETAPAAHLLLAKASLSPERVEALLEMALRDRVVLQAARVDVARLTAEDALTALPIAAHDGVQNYLEKMGVTATPPASDGTPPKPEARPIALAVDAEHQVERPKPGYSRADILSARLDLQARNHRGKAFTLYFDTGDATVDREDFKSVAAACNYAAGLSKARFVITGHTDTVGRAVDNDELSSRRAGAVADAIRNDPRFREALSVVEFGEQVLAVATGDNVPEPMNRRVEILVLEQP